MENNVRLCQHCGEPKTAFRNGKEIFTRCKCDWEAAFQERVRKTIHPSFYKNGIKKMCHWSPKIFSPTECGKFKEFIRAQKIVAINTIWDFCYKQAGTASSGRPLVALQRSIADNQNLYIRGPQGSGRGLLTASIKFMAAAKDISVTELPGEFDLMKSEIIAAEAFSGDVAKATIIDKYINVDILAVENVRAETTIKFSGEKAPQKFRGAAGIDTILAKRSTGSFVFTSSDLIGQIMDTLGDKLLEELVSEKTSLILLLSPGESDELLVAIGNRHKRMLALLETLRGVKDKQTVENREFLGLLDKCTDEEKFSLIQEALYYNETCRNLPSFRGADLVESLEAMIACGKAPRQAQQILANFLEDKEINGIPYKDKVKKARIEAIRSCQFLATKMIEKEIVRTSEVLELATSKDIEKEVTKAIQLMSEMSGNGKK